MRKNDNKRRGKLCPVVTLDTTFPEIAPAVSLVTSSQEDRNKGPRQLGALRDEYGENKRSPSRMRDRKQAQDGHAAGNAETARETHTDELELGVVGGACLTKRSKYSRRSRHHDPADEPAVTRHDNRFIERKQQNHMNARNGLRLPPIETHSNKDCLPPEVPASGSRKLKVRHTKKTAQVKANMHKQTTGHQTMIDAGCHDNLASGETSQGGLRVTELPALQTKSTFVVSHTVDEFNGHRKLKVRHTKKTRQIQSNRDIAKNLHDLTRDFRPGATRVVLTFQPEGERHPLAESVSPTDLVASYLGMNNEMGAAYKCDLAMISHRESIDEELLKLADNQCDHQSDFRQTGDDMVTSRPMMENERRCMTHEHLVGRTDPSEDKSPPVCQANKLNNPKVFKTSSSTLKPITRARQMSNADINEISPNRRSDKNTSMTSTNGATSESVAYKHFPDKSHVHSSPQKGRHSEQRSEANKSVSRRPSARTHTSQTGLRIDRETICPSPTRKKENITSTFTYHANKSGTSAKCTKPTNHTGTNEGNSHSITQCNMPSSTEAYGSRPSTASEKFVQTEKSVSTKARVYSGRQKSSPPMPIVSDRCLTVTPRSQRLSQCTASTVRSTCSIGRASTTQRSRSRPSTASTIKSACSTVRVSSAQRSMSRPSTASAILSACSTARASSTRSSSKGDGRSPPWRF